MSPQRAPRDELLGFTLLEVMVAVAILGLTLTVILASQVGLFSMGNQAQRSTVAISLMRCKMSELEEQLLSMGYPEIDVIDEGPCCGKEDAQLDYTCAWRIERIELPLPMDQTDGGTLGSSSASPLDGGDSLGALGASSLAASGFFAGMPPPAMSDVTGSFAGAPNGFPMGYPPGMPTDYAGGMNPYGPMAPMGGMPMGGMPMGPGGPTGTPMDMLGMLTGGTGSLSALGLPDLASSASGGGTDALAGVLAAGASGGTGALAPLVMTFVYPSLKPMLEASVRKLTVTVGWRDGITKRSLEVVQWVTNPMLGGFSPNGMGSTAGSGSPLGGLLGGLLGGGTGASPVGGGPVGAGLPGGLSH